MGETTAPVPDAPAPPPKQPERATTFVYSGPDLRGHAEQLAEKKARFREMGGPERIERQHADGKLTVRERLDLLFDPGTFSNCENVPGSNSRSRRSRTVSLPSACWRSMRSGPPISRNLAFFSASCSACPRRSGPEYTNVVARSGCFGGGAGASGTGAVVSPMVPPSGPFAGAQRRCLPGPAREGVYVVTEVIRWARWLGWVGR